MVKNMIYNQESMRERKKERDRETERERMRRAQMPKNIKQLKMKCLKS